MRAALPVVLALVLGQACAAGQAGQRPDEVPTQPTTAPEPASPAETPVQESTPTPEAAAAVPPPLPPKVDGGQIARHDLQAVLQGGVARFLQRVHTEPCLEHGRFVGWRLLERYPREDALTPDVLAPGDTVMRVNGQSIERPEQFKNVWDAMATSSELVLEVRRGQQRSTVRYTIVD